MAARRSSSPSGARAATRGRDAAARVSAPARTSTGSGGGLLAIQRLRILTGAALCWRKLGAGRVSVAEVISCAGVSRRTFYEIYRDRDECLMAALEEGLRRASAQVLPAYRAEGSWREATRAGVEAFLGFLDADRAFGSLLVIDWLAAGDRALARRAEVLCTLVDVLQEGARLPRASKGVGRSTAEAALGGVLAVLHSRLLADPQKPVLPLAGELTGMLLLPYLGAAAAAREAARRPPPAASVPEPAGDPLAGVKLRLTGRTVAVIAAVAANPQASNRTIGHAAGIGDQGQVSKLLSRLQRLGLIENRRSGAAIKGRPNAWRLTAEGRRLERSLRL